MGQGIGERAQVEPPRGGCLTQRLGRLAPLDIAPRTSTSGTSNRDRAWVLDRDNFLKGHQPRRGDVVMVPLTCLPLSEAGRAEAAERLQLAGGAREAYVALDARGHAEALRRSPGDARKLA